MDNRKIMMNNYNLAMSLVNFDEKNPQKSEK